MARSIHHRSADAAAVQPPLCHGLLCREVSEKIVADNAMRVLVTLGCIMPAKVKCSFTCLVTATILVACLASCDAKVDGTYAGQDTGFFDKLTFTSKGKVEITFMGMTKEGTYVVEDKRVKITVAGDTQIFTIDDKGCIDGGGLLGKYCKSESVGSNSSSSSGRSVGSSGTGGPLAGMYKAGDANGSITLHFQSGQKVHLTMAETSGNKESADGTYAISDNQVTITIPGGMPLVLIHKGDILEGAFDGQSIQFLKQ